MLEVDAKWPGHLFNTTCLVGPEGILYKYRKVNTWIPYEVHTSPHDLEGYDEPLFRLPKRPSAGSVVQSVTTGCFRKRCANSPPMAPKF
jgi:hypothetical protein